MPPLAIETDRLGRSFGDLRAVDELTLQVPRGTIFGFLGPNGAGKTTTIRMLLGLIAPTDGRAEVMGYDVALRAPAIRARAGAMMEHAGLYEQLSALDNLEFHGRLHGLQREAYRARARELLDTFGLWGRRDDRVAGFSRGMRQKLGLARALLHRPTLLFLDEPTAGLDPEAAAALRTDLLRLRGDGVTIFLTSHNLFEAERLCDLVGVIRQGRLRAFGPPDALAPDGPVGSDRRTLEDAYLEIMSRPAEQGA